MNDIDLIPESQIVGTPEWAQTLTDAIKADHEYSERDVTLFAEHAAEAKLNKIWEVVFGDGSWERYCEQCLGLPFTYVDAIIVGVGRLRNEGYEGEIAATMAQQVAERAEKPLSLADVGRPKNVDNYQHFEGDMQGGTSADYLTARIARDHPDILEDMKQGKYRSVRQAAIAAGIVHPKTRYSLPDDPQAAGRYLAQRIDDDWMRAMVDAYEDACDAALAKERREAYEHDQP